MCFSRDLFYQVNIPVAASLWPNAHPKHRHVIDHGIGIGANVLCHTIDLLCGAIILVLKGSSLRNINLPRSWLNILLRKDRSNSDGFLDIGEIVVKTFIATLGKLAYSLHTGQQEIGGIFCNLIPGL